MGWDETHTHTPIPPWFSHTQTYTHTQVDLKINSGRVLLYLRNVREKNLEARSDTYFTLYEITWLAACVPIDRRFTNVMDDGD